MLLTTQAVYPITSGIQSDAGEWQLLSYEDEKKIKIRLGAVFISPEITTIIIFFIHWNPGGG